MILVQKIKLQFLTVLVETILNKIFNMAKESIFFLNKKGDLDPKRRKVSPDILLIIGGLCRERERERL